MRELLAKWMAGLTALMVCILAVLFAFIQNPGGTGAVGVIPAVEDLPGWDRDAPSRLIHDSIDIELGKALYATLRCRGCHSIGGEGNRRNPLDGAGSRLDAGEVRQWVLAPGEIDPDIRKPDYTFLSEDQVTLLVKYIMSLK